MKYLNRLIISISLFSILTLSSCENSLSRNNKIEVQRKITLYTTGINQSLNEYQGYLVTDTFLGGTGLFGAAAFGSSISKLQKMILYCDTSSYPTVIDALLELKSDPEWVNDEYKIDNFIEEYQLTESKLSFSEAIFESGDKYMDTYSLIELTTGLEWIINIDKTQRPHTISSITPTELSLKIYTSMNE